MGENPQRGFRMCPAQTDLFKHRRLLEAGNFGFRKYRNLIVLSVLRNKGADWLCSNCEAELHHCFCICKIWFSHEAAQMYEGRNSYKSPG